MRGGLRRAAVVAALIPVSGCGGSSGAKFAVGDCISVQANDKVPQYGPTTARAAVRSKSNGWSRAACGLTAGPAGAQRRLCAGGKDGLAGG
jgi:hypothetical protein